MKAETPFYPITRLLTTEITKATVSWVLSTEKGQKPVSKDPSFRQLKWVSWFLFLLL